jgi:hypothetical protein
LLFEELEKHSYTRDAALFPRNASSLDLEIRMAILVPG